MSEAGAQPRRTVAAIRRSWRPGWIWLIPIAAVLVVLWLIVRALTRGGQDITITFDDVHGLKQKNINVMYRGMVVGQVTGIALSKDGGAVIVSANIDDAAAQFLKGGTRFWLKGANPNLGDLSSLGSILSGPSIEMDPGSGPSRQHFAGISHQPAVPVASGPAVDYRVYFTGAVGALKVGEPVKLDGFAVGEVQAIGFHYDPDSGGLSTPVTVALYPRLFHLAAGDDAAQFRAAMGNLIQGGLRARLDRDPPLIGSYAVTLEMVPGAAAATPALTGGMPQIPQAPGGGLDTIVDRINRLPLEAIAQNALDITKHVDGLASSPKLADSIVQLDAALKQVHQTAAAAGPQITKLVAMLRQTAAELDQTAKAARATIGDSTSQTGLNPAMQEVTLAARSLRELADYLDQHPEAIIKGRSDK